MKNRLYIIAALTILFGSCASPYYLPNSNEISTDEYGSFIKLFTDNRPRIQGELIAIDSNNVVILTHEEKECVTVPMKNVIGFDLKYADAKNYAWTIPTFTLATVGHGGFFILTAPINLIGTIAVVSSSNKAFMYNETTLSYEQLKMFARFPNGIPKNVDVHQIK